MLSEVVMFEQTNASVLIFAVFVGVVAPILSVAATFFVFRYIYSAAAKIFQSSDSDIVPKNHKTSK